MRMIGTVPSEEAAATLQDYLLTRQIKVQVEPNGAAAWEIWVFDEDQLEAARTELAEFNRNPTDPRFRESAAQAEKFRRQEAKTAAEVRKRQVNVRERWNRPLAAQAPVTILLIFASVAITVLGSHLDGSLDLGNNPEPYLKHFYIVPPTLILGDDARWTIDYSLKAVREGEVWRLVTPIFIHYSVLHILFNMLWLRSLGGTIESRYGSLRFTLLVLVVAIAANLAEYFWTGPAFGGMSGVVFGLFGFVWMKSRYDSDSGLYMPPNTVFMMMVWLVFCFTGAAGNIANANHTVGLVAGAVIGYLPVIWRRMR